MGELMEKYRVMVALRIGGENGGPYISHKRIMESNLANQYEFIPLWVPRARYLLNPLNMAKFAYDIYLKKPDLVQLAGLQLEAFLPLIACRLARVKTIVAVHGSILESERAGYVEKFLAKFFEKYTVNHATAVYGVSDYVSGWKICKEAKNYFGTIYNFCLPKVDKKETTESIRSELGLSKDDVLFVSSGRIVEEKGFDILWSAIQSVGHRNNIKYIVVGDGPYKNKWQAEIREKGYEKEVYLLGYRENVVQLIKDCDAFIICTKHETLCISLLEAAAVGLPLIATDVGGIPEIINSGENGILVKNGDICGFKNGIEQLANDPVLRAQMGTKAKESVLDKFSPARIEKKLDELYSKVLEIN